MSEIIGITWKWARRCAIALIGGTVVLTGVCMIVLPGPALVVIPAGLAILGVEFAWARIWLRKVREGGDYAAQHLRKRWTARSNSQPRQ
jgi:tellurite resistance protein TerC